MQEKLSKIERELGSLSEIGKNQERQYERISKTLDKIADLLPELISSSRTTTELSTKVSTLRDDLSSLKVKSAVLESKQNRSEKIVYGILTIVIGYVITSLMQVAQKGI